MNKSELISRVAARAGITKAQAHIALKSFAAAAKTPAKKSGPVRRAKVARFKAGKEI